jgi:hypothetical protein
VVDNRFQSIVSENMGIWFSWILREDWDSNEYSDYSGVINDLRHDLLDLIDTDYGLLDELFTHGILTNQEVDIIQSHSSVTNRVAELLDYVVKLTPDKQDKFLIALDNNHQKNASNYIRANGDRSKAAGDWPLLKSEEIRKWDGNKEEMIDRIDPRNGLLDEMLSAGCINDRLRQEIESKPTRAQVNEYIFRALRRRNVIDYHIFVECLKKTKQYPIVHLLEPDAHGAAPPLNEDRRKSIQEKYRDLVSTMNTTGSLLDRLFTTECITQRQMEFIQSESLNAGRNRRLLDIILRGSERDFIVFMECLDESEQESVRQILLDDVALMKAKSLITSTEEELICQRFMALLRNSSSDELERLYAAVTEVVTDLRSRDVQVVAATVGHSIGLYFICKSFTGLQHLYELYCSGQLKRTVEGMFTCLLDKGRPVNLTSLQWRRSNCMKCFRFMSSSTGLPIFCEIYQLAENGEDNVPAAEDCDVLVNCSPSDLYAERLPFELMESIMIRTSACLYDVLNRKTPRAEVYTTATLCAVSYQWW